MINYYAQFEVVLIGFRLINTGNLQIDIVLTSACFMHSMLLC